MSIMEASLETLKGLFDDKPDALKIFDLQSLESGYLKERFRQSSQLFANPVNLWVTGRTGAGKTSLGNSLLDSRVMKSNGVQDCTDFVGFFSLASNLRFFDTPGIASNINFENINRAALLMDQLPGNKFSRPPVVPLKPSDKLVIKDFSKCSDPKIKPEEDLVTVEHWQSPEQQADVEPDIILYVMAPHMLFLDPDRQYLGELLETWKNLKQRCIVIPVLNIFRKDDGTILATSNQIEYAKREIPEIYRAVYSSDEDIPQIDPIVQINSKTGDGIPKITELICKIMPPEKIGNLEQVLQDDLKKYAEEERTNRYYRTLSLIAGRLARYTVDKKIQGQNLLQAAASAISAYGVMTFKNAEAVAEIRDQIDAIVQQVDEVEKSQQQAITEKENVMGTKDITRIKPIETEETEEYDELRPQTVTKTVEDEMLVPSAEKVTLKREVIVPEERTREEQRKLLGFIPAGKKQVRYTENVSKMVQEEQMVFTQKRETVERQVTSIEWVKETKTRVVKRITGFEEEVVDTVQVVVGQVDKIVGTKYLSGGYPAIKLLLGIGLGVKNFCTKKNNSWSASLEQGELQAENKLTPVKSRIEQLVEASDGEQELIQVLESVL